MNNDGTAAAILKVARSQLGIREGQTNGHWNNRVKYTDWYSKLVGDKDYETGAWCAMFVSWCARQAGVPEDVIPNHAYTPTGYAWFKKRGRLVKTPQPGDIIYLYSPKQGCVYHIGIVEHADDGRVTTIEGNTNETGGAEGYAVFRKYRPITPNTLFCRPAYKSTTQQKEWSDMATKEEIKQAFREVLWEPIIDPKDKNPNIPNVCRSSWRNNVITIQNALTQLLTKKS